ncbi:hypothetical protein B0T14DRAFT_567527 [Immersiella caudata]|uniref:Uncharacterized protein n=1 Tax=Immersiella caudata TaxID=314043 RepID=A0AA39WT30_9PEZI|nr:hypothetical protein B0T14DRAFT_567527 [Immersiella caudata]
MSKVTVSECLHIKKQNIAYFGAGGQPKNCKAWTECKYEAEKVAKKHRGHSSSSYTVLDSRKADSSHDSNAMDSRLTCPLWTRYMAKGLSTLFNLAGLILFIIAKSNGIPDAIPAYVICPLMIIMSVWGMIHVRKAIKGLKHPGRGATGLAAIFDLFQCGLALCAGIGSWYLIVRADRSIIDGKDTTDALPYLAHPKTLGGQLATIAVLVLSAVAASQVFLRPFSKPAIVVSDYREVIDILSRRDGVGFKRGIKSDVFKGIIPHSLTAMETFDPRFRANREMSKGIMMTSWLRDINALYIYRGTLDVVHIWRETYYAGRGPGRNRDGFGDSVESLITIPRDETERDTTEIRERVAADRWPKEFQALSIIAEYLANAFYSPLPRFYHIINNLRPSVREARRTLDKHISSYDPDVNHDTVSFAQDSVYHQERRIAEKEGRKFDPKDPRIRDNRYGYLLAGHDTSAGALIWCLRHLLAHPPPLPLTPRAQAT